MEGEKNKFGSEKTTVPEYSFDAGVPKILDRITDILKKQPYAVVAFNASDKDVGKTKLAMTLIQELFQRGIFCKNFHDPKEMEKEENREKMVVIFDQMEWDSSERSSHKMIKENHDADVASSFEKIGYEINGIDLWIGIYRPDKPFFSNSRSGKEYAPIADIIIRNEEARDKMIR
jgi:hypothetical protein